MYMQNPKYIKNFVNVGLQNIRLFEYENTDSTNTRAKLFAKNRPAEDKSPAIFFARAQSAGRGTRGRDFESPADAGAYMSILFYPELFAADSGKITGFSAVCVCRVLHRLMLRTAKIKWVNDLTVNDKKLAGILTEGAVDENGRLAYAIVGIGINTKKAQHSPEVAARMTSLDEEGINISPRELTDLICEEFFAKIGEIGTDATLNEYRSLSALSDRLAEIITPSGTFTEYML